MLSQSGFTPIHLSRIPLASYPSQLESRTSLDPSGKSSGKGSAIIKTLDRGRKFKEERYLSADSVFTTVSENHFNVKAKCKASMKKEIRRVEVSLDRETSLVVSSKCSCPAGKSRYCNHVMALLF